MRNMDARLTANSGFGGVRLRDVQAIEFIRKMRGRSQTAMLRCSDGRYYVVKMMGNPQGTNVLGNECLATILASAVDLPVPSFASVFVSRALIDSTPGMWFENEMFSGKPEPGQHFGSLLLGESFGLKWPTERLSASHFPFITNRCRFVDTLVFDVWANNQDNRQAIFTEGYPTSSHRSAVAHFIDHGFMFGGTEGTFNDSLMRYFYIDFSVYKGLELLKLIESAIDRFRIRIPRMLAPALSEVPSEWYSFNQTVLRETLLDRLGMLEELIGPAYEKLVGA